MGFFDDIFPLIFGLIFFMCIGIFIYNFARILRKDRKNDRSPQLTVETTVVTKRIHVWGDHSHTEYFATFQVSSGDRMELEVPDDKYGYLVEGDRGRLTFQGTRFIGFDRT